VRKGLGSAATRTVVGVLGLAVVLLSASLVVGGVTTATTYHGTTYGGRSISFAVLELTAGVALLAAATVLLAERSTATLGLVAAVASAAWLAPVWVGWEGGPAVVRSIGLVVSPILPAFLVGLATLVPPVVTRAGAAASAAVLAVGAAAVAQSLVRDPLLDRYCWSDCTTNAFLVHADPLLARRLGWVVLGLAAASGVAAALAAWVRLVRAAPVTRRVSGPALAGSGLAGIALATYAASLVLEPHESPGRPLYEGLFVARALVLLALAAALAWLAVRPRLVRGLVTRLAVDLERSAAEGGLGRLLAGALGDPGLRLGYPVGPGGRIVDAEGRQVAFDPARRVTPIVGEEGPIALVESEATSVDALERALGPAAHLALGNERLRAEALAQLADVTESRARIVETSDAARRRIERDLHDGAQQRMLALTYDLRVALANAESAGNDRAAEPLRAALDRTITASQELRDVAHGIFPAELSAAGLEAALQSLADVHPLGLDVRIPAGRRYRPDIEAAAYAVVAEAVDGAEGTLVATLDELAGSLHLVVEGIQVSNERLVRVEDRVRAAGGDVNVRDLTLDAVLPSG
jgi:signal transduction histidine kinase